MNIIVLISPSVFTKIRKHRLMLIECSEHLKHIKMYSCILAIDKREINKNMNYIITRTSRFMIFI